MYIGRLSFYSSCKLVETEQFESINLQNGPSTAHLLIFYIYLLCYFAAFGRLFLGTTARKTTVGSTGVELAVRCKAGCGQAQQDHAHQ